MLSSEENGTKDILGIEDYVVPRSSIIGLPGQITDMREGQLILLVIGWCDWIKAKLYRINMC